jgi:membrane protease YdiL (CAAX protease family)
MKKIVGYLRDYFRSECNYRYLALLMVAVAAAIYVNYFVVSENVWIKSDPQSGRRLAKYLGGYFTMFGGAYFLNLVVDKDPRLRSPRLWGLIIFAVICFSLRAWYRPGLDLITTYVRPIYATLAYKLIINALGFVLLFIPCAIYWLIADRKHTQLYGLHAKGVVLWPYFILILIMLPVLFAAGAQKDFQEMYPRAAHLWIPRDDPAWLSGTLLYEAVYSLDYFVTEFFFRGFLIIPFFRIIGPKAILPMCAFYVAIHFDKPLGECISSFFGGLLLGILAYRTGSIYGGVIVHLGIALAMELVGWWYMMR